MLILGLTNLVFSLGHKGTHASPCDRQCVALLTTEHGEYHKHFSLFQCKYEFKLQTVLRSGVESGDPISDGKMLSRNIQSVQVASRTTRLGWQVWKMEAECGHRKFRYWRLKSLQGMEQKKEASEYKVNISVWVQTVLCQSYSSFVRNYLWNSSKPCIHPCPLDKPAWGGLFWTSNSCFVACIHFLAFGVLDFTTLRIATPQILSTHHLQNISWLCHYSYTVNCLCTEFKDQSMTSQRNNIPLLWCACAPCCYFSCILAFSCFLKRPFSLKCLCYQTGMYLHNTTYSYF